MSEICPSQVMTNTQTSGLQMENVQCGPGQDLCRPVQSQTGRKNPDLLQHQRWLELDGPTYGGLLCATHKRSWPSDPSPIHPDAISIGDGGFIIPTWGDDYRIFDLPFEDSETEVVDFVQSREASSWMDGIMRDIERPLDFQRNSFESDFEIRSRISSKARWEPRPHVHPDMGSPSWVETEVSEDPCDAPGIFSPSGALRPAEWVERATRNAQARDEEFATTVFVTPVTRTPLPGDESIPVEDLTRQRMASAFPAAPVARKPSEEEAWESRSVATSLAVDAEVRARDSKLDCIEQFGVCRCDLSHSEQYRLFLNEKGFSVE